MDKQNSGSWFEETRILKKVLFPFLQQLQTSSNAEESDTGSSLITYYTSAEILIPLSINHIKPNDLVKLNEISKKKCTIKIFDNGMHFAVYTRPKARPLYQYAFLYLIFVVFLTYIWFKYIAAYNEIAATIIDQKGLWFLLRNI